MEESKTSLQNSNSKYSSTSNHPDTNTKEPSQLKSDEPATPPSLQEVDPIVDQALHIPLILLKIFNNLSVPHLKSCRLVNSTWAFLAAQLIQKRDSSITILRSSCSNTSNSNDSTISRATLFHCTLHQRTLRQFFPSPATPTLSDLNTILAKSDLYPSTHFALIGDYTHNNESEILQLFKLQGSKIATLELDISIPQSLLISILLNLAPNLKNLTVGRLPSYCWHDDESSTENFKLPALKHFAWSCVDLREYSTVIKILSPITTPNLLTLGQIQSPLDLQIVIDANRGNLVSDLKLARDLNNLNKGHALPLTQLKKLRFDIERYDTLKSNSEVTVGRIKNFCEVLLQTTKDTLNCLEYTEMCATFDHFELPGSFENLQELRLGSRFGQKAVTCFPRSVSLGQTFPNLKTLDCTHLRMRVDSTWFEYFPPEVCNRGQLTSVEVLKVSDNICEGWTKNLKELCPNFTKIVVEGAWEECKIREVLKNVCECWGQLVSIEVKVNSPAFNNLDTILIGLPEEKCEALAMEKPGNSNFTGEEEGQRAPSIRDLRELKLFKISLGYGVQVESCKILIISPGCVSYALQRMSGLRVTLEYDHGSRWAQEMRDQLMTLVSHGVVISHRRDPRTQPCTM